LAKPRRKHKAVAEGTVTETSEETAKPPSEPKPPKKQAPPLPPMAPSPPKEASTRRPSTLSAPSGSKSAAHESSGESGTANKKAMSTERALSSEEVVPESSDAEGGRDAGGLTGGAAKLSLPTSQPRRKGKESWNVEDAVGGGGSGGGGDQVSASRGAARKQETQMEELRPDGEDEAADVMKPETTRGGRSSAAREVSRLITGEGAGEEEAEVEKDMQIEELEAMLEDV
jgi:hypothetical protein